MSVRKYAGGDRVVRRDGKVGEVIQVQSDPYPYLVDFGNRWAACWMSGLDLEPAAEAAPPSKAKVDGDFATVAEHIAAWKAGGRRWAKVEGFNVDAVQAEKDVMALADAVAATLAADPVMAVLCGVPVEVPRGADGLTDAERTAEWQRLSAVEELRAANIALMARLERVGALALGHDDGACPTCGTVRSA